MAVNTVNELISLLNQVDRDATVLAAIANDAPTATGNGPGPGLVTTRLGNNVKNVQKVIADIENGITESIRPALQDEGVTVLDNPGTINFVGTQVAVTDVSGVATVTIADPGITQVDSQTGTAYTLPISSANSMVTMDNVAANILTIDPVATTAYPLGYTVEVIQLGAGTTTIQASAGVDLNGVTAGAGDIIAQYDVVKLRHVASDVWIVSGDIGAIV